MHVIRWKVLVIDDSPEIQDMISSLLATLGYQSASCASRDVALSEMSSIAPDLVLMDLSMPGMALDEFLAHGKADHPQTRLVLYSAGDAESEAQKHGIKYWVSKPFNIMRLAMVLAKCVDDGAGGQLQSVHVENELVPV